MSPYMCHIHNGMYVADDEIEGCQHEVCVKLRSLPVLKGPLFSIGHLKRQNAEGTTTASEVREVLDGVKPEDRDKIARAK